MEIKLGMSLNVHITDRNVSTNLSFKQATLIFELPCPYVIELIIYAYVFEK